MITSHQTLVHRSIDFKADWFASHLLSLDFERGYLFGGQYPCKVYGKRVLWHDQAVSLTHLELLVSRRCEILYQYQGVRVNTTLWEVTDIRDYLHSRLMSWSQDMSTVIWVTVVFPGGSLYHTLVRTLFPLAISDLEVVDAY